jgi:hypothetical protein
MDIQNIQQEMMFLGMNEPVDTGKKCEEDKLNYTLNNQVVYGYERSSDTGVLPILAFIGINLARGAIAYVGAEIAKETYNYIKCKS